MHILSVQLPSFPFPFYCRVPQNFNNNHHKALNNSIDRTLFFRRQYEKPVSVTVKTFRKITLTHHVFSKIMPQDLAEWYILTTYIINQDEIDEY